MNWLPVNRKELYPLITLRFCIILLTMSCLLCMSSLPAYSKIKLKLPTIKLKLPESVKVTTGAQPVAGSHDAAVTMCGANGKKAQNATSLLNMKASMAPVSWKGEESAQKSEEPAIDEKSETVSSELSFSLVGKDSSVEKQTAAPEKESTAQTPEMKEKAIDFSKVVQGEPSIPGQSCDVSYVPGLVSRINDDMFNHYKNSARIISIINLPPVREESAPAYDPREDDVVVTYKGYQMTKRAARCFARLEDLIAKEFPGRRIIITSTTGGKHLDPKHYQGKAIDFVVDGLSARESLLVESLARQADFMPYNEYIKSSTYKTGDHMHVDSR